MLCYDPQDFLRLLAIDLKLAPFLALFAMFLQFAVFLQPLLPERFQIAPVCETIANALEQHQSYQSLRQVGHNDQHIHAALHERHAADGQGAHQQHSADHQCLYCKVHGHLVAFLHLDIQEVFDRLQVRLLAFQQAFRHVYFALQQLFLIPQGRAPPLFIA